MTQAITKKTFAAALVLLYGSTVRTGVGGPGGWKSQAAADLGVSRRMINYMISGERSIPEETARRVLKKLEDHQDTVGDVAIRIRQELAASLTAPRPRRSTAAHVAQ